MKSTELNRRDFNRLTAAAFGGIVAGAAIGCGGGDEGGGAGGPDAGGGPGAGTVPPGSDVTGGPKMGDPPGGDKVAADENPLLSEPHVCRGLNACQGLGKQGDNDCAGLSTCATAGESSCHDMNECKGEGGCEETAGQNACKNMGNCHVPLQNDDAWETARAALKKALEAKGKTLNEAPEA